MEVDKNRRHTERMARKKAVIDEKIQAADIDRGVLLVLTGNGKGKSSSAFGMLARALGHGMQAGVAQFIKGRSDHRRGGLLPPPTRRAVAPARRGFYLGDAKPRTGYRHRPARLGESARHAAG